MHNALIARVGLVTLALTFTAVSASVVACDDKAKDATPPANSAAASASAALAAALSAAKNAPSASSAPVAASADPAPFGSAGSSLVTGDPKDLVLTMKDPAKEPEKTVKAASGGSLTLFLPDFPGTVWSIATDDKAIGKAKEEVIPGFAPGTNGHQFKWSGLKAGKYKLVFGNKKAGDKDKAAKPTSTFTLTVDAS